MFSRVAKQGNSDAGSAVMSVLVKLIRLSECRQDFVADLLYLRGRFWETGAEIFEHDNRFVAPGTRNGIAVTNAHGQSGACLLQKLVAQFVAKGIVECLEVVQVDEQQCAVLLAAGRGSKCLFQSVEQQPAVGQAGQRVVESQAVDLVLRRLARTDVFVNQILPACGL